mmetsp:Transcript_9551/g.15326  ORF Transcript_9551/g.15326 Transcript_9551/m.15326 type:complete len:301 (-) Transcript_9551:166-1068(-)|eukprot:CAMPEP_0178755758 /NCGR_PEP_ID=MMETSP0744-20121128/12902_1 /TAXON_ID=913974 /ORGANISM="Nitzschia punctata, Strain CCMP561" /LENGTH=300 /DNA_ID=CAMNT_0020409835 /DNA_START=110 /DNA_END=1012 /DNA_ORIENTATION=-
MNTSSLYPEEVDALEPTNPPGSQQSNVVSGPTGVETVSGSVDWRVLCFFILWVLGIILLVLVVLQILCHRREKKEPRHDTTDAKNKNNNTVAGETEDIENFGDNTAVENEHRRRNDGASSWASLAILAFSMAVACILSITTNSSCTFLTPTQVDAISKLGLWKADLLFFQDEYDTDICYSTFRAPYYIADRPQVVARVTAVLACVVGGICMLSLLWTIARSSSAMATGDSDRLARSKSQIRQLMWPLLLTTFIQLMPLCFLATQYCPSSDSCSLGFGAVSALTATYFWLLSAIGVTYLPL